MRIAIISFTRPGNALAEKLAEALEAHGHNCCFAKFADVGGLFALAREDEGVKYADVRGESGLCGRFAPGFAGTAKHGRIERADGRNESGLRSRFAPGFAGTAKHGMVFIGAAGIAVRAIAPHVSSKYTDPAIVVCDEQGLFSISLLSGHEGGANDLAGQVSAILGSTPVITTASELKTIIAGCGCRRAVSADQIESAFISAGIWPERIAKLCTIDIKRLDEGLMEFSKKFDFPVEFFSAEELMAVSGDFSSSSFVEGVTGADNVCERAAVLGGGKGRLIVPKQSVGGVSVAAFVRDES